MKTFKIGELVYVSKLNQVGDYGYGIVIDIVDKINGDSYQQKDVITGRGEHNTKVDFIIDVIYAGTDPWAPDGVMEKCKRVRNCYNPHDVCKMTYQDVKNRYLSTLDRMNKKLAIFKKYELDRNQKINTILNG